MSFTEPVNSQPEAVPGLREPVDKLREAVDEQREPVHELRELVHEHASPWTALADLVHRPWLGVDGPGRACPACSMLVPVAGIHEHPVLELLPELAGAEREASSAEPAAPTDASGRAAPRGRSAAGQSVPHEARLAIGGALQ